MKKLGNQAFTVIEILISFVLVMIILMNMFAVVMSYQHASNEQELRTDYISFQAVVTKDIQTDIVKLGLTSIDEVLPASSCGASVEKCIELSFQDGTKKRLFVYYNRSVASEARNKYIQYGQQKYKIRDDIPDDSQIPSGKTAYDYQTVRVIDQALLKKQQVGQTTLYTIHIGIEVLSLNEDYGIHIVTTTGLG